MGIDLPFIDEYLLLDSYELSEDTHRRGFLVYS